MFVSPRSVATVETTVASLLDLASHARFSRTSRAIGRICRLRAASPQVVALWRVAPTKADDDGRSAGHAPWRRNRAGQRAKQPHGRSSPMGGAGQRSSPMGGAGQRSSPMGVGLSSAASRLPPSPPPPPPPPSPAKFQTRIWTALGRVYYGDYRHVRDLRLDDGKHEHVHEPPTPSPPPSSQEDVAAGEASAEYDLPFRHAVWRMAPRVLDLCHLQLPTDTVRRLVANAAPALEHFCVDATRVADIVGILAAESPQLRELCLYGAPAALHIFSVLAHLPRIERLVAPGTNEFLGVAGWGAHASHTSTAKVDDNNHGDDVASGARDNDDGGAAAVTTDRASRLVSLALLMPHRYPTHLSTHRVDWAKIGVAVPRLVEFALVDTLLGTDALRSLLSACPHLTILRCGGIFTSSPTDEATLREAAVPTDRGTAEMAATAATEVCAATRWRITRLEHVEHVSVLTALDPHPDALEHLWCDFRANVVHDVASAAFAATSSAVCYRSLDDVLTRFTRLRFLSVWTDAELDGTHMRLIGDHLPLLETLWLSGREPPM